MNYKDQIVDYAVALRAAQKQRIAAPEGPAKSAASTLEHLVRKKLNEVVDLYQFTLEKAEAQRIQQERER